MLFFFFASHGRSPPQHRYWIQRISSLVENRNKRSNETTQSNIVQQIGRKWWNNVSVIRRRHAKAVNVDIFHPQFFAICFCPSKCLSHSVSTFFTRALAVCMSGMFLVFSPIVSKLRYQNHNTNFLRFIFNISFKRNLFAWIYVCFLLSDFLQRDGCRQHWLNNNQHEATLFDSN